MTRSTGKRARALRATRGLRWFVLSSLLLASSAHAQHPVRECIAAHAHGQELRLDGHLLASRASFLACSAAGCPDVVRAECAELLKQVEAATPSIAIAVATAHGAPSPVQIRLDDRPDRVVLDGRPISLDPGPHRLDVISPDGTVHQTAFSLRLGERGRRVEVDATRPEADPARGSHRSWSDVHPLAYLFAGVGAAALGSFAYFGLSGKHKQEQLEACTPHCSEAEVSIMRDRYLAADLSLGAAVASMALAAYYFFWPPGAGRHAPAGVLPRATGGRTIGNLIQGPGVGLSWRAEF